MKTFNLPIKNRTLQFIKITRTKRKRHAGETALDSLQDPWTSLVSTPGVPAACPAPSSAAGASLPSRPADPQAQAGGRARQGRPGCQLSRWGWSSVLWEAVGFSPAVLSSSANSPSFPGPAAGLPDAGAEGGGAAGVALPGGCCQASVFFFLFIYRMCVSVPWSTFLVNSFRFKQACILFLSSPKDTFIAF